MSGTRSSKQLSSALGELAGAAGRDPGHHEQTDEAAAHRREIWRQKSEYSELIFTILCTE